MIPFATKPGAKIFVVHNDRDPCVTVDFLVSSTPGELMNVVMLEDMGEQYSQNCFLTEREAVADLIEVLVRLKATLKQEFIDADRKHLLALRREWELKAGAPERRHSIKEPEVKP